MPALSGRGNNSLIASQLPHTITLFWYNDLSKLINSLGAHRAQSMNETKVQKLVTVQAEAGIPMPQPKRKPRAKTIGQRIIWPIETMQVSESFMIPDWAETTRWKAAVTRAKRDGRIPQSHQFKMFETEAGHRVWRIK